MKTSAFSAVEFRLCKSFFFSKYITVIKLDLHVLCMSVDCVVADDNPLLDFISIKNLNLNLNLYIHWRTVTYIYLIQVFMDIAIGI
jgi:hypothetical protein